MTFDLDPGQAADSSHAFPRPALRQKIDLSHRLPEAEAIQRLLVEAHLPDACLNTIRSEARFLIQALRTQRQPAGGVSALMREFSLSTDEGLALMCLAEALLRIPDDAMRNTLIRDKIAGGHWQDHIGHSPSFFVNAASWGLMLTGKLLRHPGDESLSSALTRLLVRGGEPVIRHALAQAMRLLGRQFVCGETIAQALEHSQAMLARGYRYSYDMLGEAALTADDAARYTEAYRHAMVAIGISSINAATIQERPGISIKLSALHPRYTRFQRKRVMTELLERLKRLALLARAQHIGLNIDAEESERLNLSLDLFEALMRDPDLRDWDGLGFVVQAYQKRAPDVIDHLIALARETQGASQRRIMVRLVKGAYWDSEIKRAQIEGLPDYPVYTRKPHTDVSYQACAMRLLQATALVYPQFATHNALTLAWVREAARHAGVAENYYEFQCLHGMGEALYDRIVQAGAVACRIYAPVGHHDSLLAYLVRRLLENGANTSFINRLADEHTRIEDLLIDPVQQTLKTKGAPHPQIALPPMLHAPTRRNSCGLDLSNETVLSAIENQLEMLRNQSWSCAPRLALDGSIHDGTSTMIRNPAAHDEVLGQVQTSHPDARVIEMAIEAACASGFAQTSGAQRAVILNACADLLETHRLELISLLMREAGKTLANAIAEIREATDFCRYDAAQIEAEASATHTAVADRAPLVCISPWNFPLAIFVGQIAGALAAGRCVLAKPAEQTPLIAALTTRLFHQAGVPRDALQLFLGDGEIGSALVTHPRIGGVLFTGSLPVAKAIQRQLAERQDEPARNLMLIAETGSVNAMLVDSSALVEQVVSDVLSSAFDSAGQRCSALRVLCLQEDLYDATLTMLRGAMQELRCGDPSLLETDIGPIIDAQACSRLNAYITSMRAQGFRVFQTALPAACSSGNFIAPTLIEIQALSDIPGEVFGPVLHVMPYASSQRENLIEAINASGYGLTLGLHSRINQHVTHLTRTATAGNIYVNRNIIGAVVGVQPFGGRGLSGTGPKSGGPLYLAALGSTLSASIADAVRHRRPVSLSGPTGEDNRLYFSCRRQIACIAASPEDLAAQMDAVALAGGIAYAEHNASGARCLEAATILDAVLIAGPMRLIQSWRIRVAERYPAIIPVIPWDWNTDPARQLWRLIHEQSVSINTTAAGGNTRLITLDEDFEG